MEEGDFAPSTQPAPLTGANFKYSLTRVGSLKRPRNLNNKIPQSKRSKSIWKEPLVVQEESSDEEDRVYIKLLPTKSLNSLTPSTVSQQQEQVSKFLRCVQVLFSLKK
eukprot:TRINITY_DN11793_c0_g1_i1.p1 TRINITY_DN11793_c0_g1~~TRINITY_DN11793_c0_g1_i1.p1  ORF type:complete len:108 (+),score=20.91 TRINITY_DN11793_c0_g1_i1:119-442(+)